MASPYSDYDEDVVLPGSALGQYLREFESSETDASAENDELPPLKNDIFGNPLNIRDKLFNIRLIFLETLKQYLSFIYNIFVPCLVPFEYSELKYILDIAKNSKVLVSEDLSILLNYEADEESNAELRLSYSSIFQQCFQLFAFVLIFFIMKSITIFNIITNEDLHVLFNYRSFLLCIVYQIILLIISITLYASIFFISAFIITNVIELLLCKILCYSMKKKLHTTECIMIMIRKCIRLIQEAELIARGFTSASVPGIVERLELSTGLPINSPQRQYPELRKCIFSWSREMFLRYKSNTQKLIISKQFGPVLDFSSQAFAMLDLKEFGNLLKYDINLDSDSDELLKLTDGLSVSSLKTMYLLLELQVSEFYKYLYLIMSFLITDDSLFNCMKKITSFHKMNSFIKCLQITDGDVLKMSCETHKYYKSIEALSDVDEQHSPAQKSNATTVEVSVHNMSLHLKSALKRLSNLEELFELEKKSKNWSYEKCLKKVDEAMKEIKSEVDVYQDYYLKCNNEVQNILHGNKSIDPIPKEKDTKKFEEHKSDILPFCDSDPIIEDEIFMAVVTESSKNKDVSSDNYVDEEKKKRNSILSGKLLDELKNVLTVKADEHRVREAKAIAKKINILDVVPEVSSEDISCSVDSEVVTEEETSSESSLSDTEIVRNVVSNEEAEKSISLDVDSDDKSQNLLLTNKQNTFAASIAALALQRQKNLGIIDDDCYTDSNDDSAEEIIGS